MCQQANKRPGKKFPERALIMTREKYGRQSQKHESDARGYDEQDT